ncbi:hypothetical protein CIP107509_01162 [Corynebacterium diphtheriae]|uniref:hypothetical protein n=1 Tax=Corynebacterium diphtheriae TaxID=1717 RepID=UPI0013CB15C2|nr:hypothetical protein [Corynebacterium diphtheriae]CAB0552581.1 hypothetical protein CIP107509_01162 [Corynebacterium diphtheriae]
MARTRSSARKAGSQFERIIADYLAHHIDDRIDRRVKTGAADKGDIGGVRYHGERVTIECKNTTRTTLAGWIKEAEIEAANDESPYPIVIHKRHGKANPAEQYATMTVETLTQLLKKGQ